MWSHVYDQEQIRVRLYSNQGMEIPDYIIPHKQVRTILLQQVFEFRPAKRVRLSILKVHFCML
jgi:hypothetical protein